MADHGVQTHEDAVNALDEYRSKLREYTAMAVCGREFVFVEKLKEWMKSSLSSLGHLIDAAYHGRHQVHHFYLPKPERICSDDDHHCCLVVFSILLDIDAGHHLHRFQREVTDRRLPIELKTLEKVLTRMRCFDNPRQLAEAFYRAQWRYCAAYFELNVARDYLDENQIIPVIAERGIKEGGTAHLSVIVVPEEFVGPDLRLVVDRSKFQDPDDNLGCRYEFALKTFHETNRSFFENEQKAFQGLAGNPGMVRYLTDYIQNEISENTTDAERGSMDSRQLSNFTYNILLEYGQYDLEDRFFLARPPVFGKELVEFWKDLFEVADAVEGIHNLKYQREDEIKEFHGWHADIKPDNILSVQDKFKLADPGFATFIPKKDGIPEEHVSGGTETYGAPERHLDRENISIRVGQAIDIWSLGCVFSMAATWLVLGSAGIREFITLRRRAINDILAARENLPSSEEPDRDLINTIGDHFHNGIEVLPEVTNWHNFLRMSVRQSDTITCQVLHLVDTHMLQGRPEQRMTASQICTELKRINDEEHEKRQEEPAESVMRALLEIDETARWEPEPESSPISIAVSARNSSLTISEARKERKSKAFSVPLGKTPNRANVLKSRLDASRNEPVISNTISESPTMIGLTRLDDPFHTARQTNPSWSSTGLGNNMAGDPYGRSPPAQSRGLTFTTTPIRRPRPHPPQNVFQAREQIDGSARWWRLKTWRDPLLTRYFGNRDIKFLVDNAETMRPHWYEATYLLETLLMKAAGQDRNGMDLYFTRGTVSRENERSISSIVTAMRDENAQPMDKIKTDMKEALTKILSKYYQDLDAEKKSHKKKALKNLTIIVLTDGLWEAMSNKDEVKDKIAAFVKKLEDMGNNLEDRPVSIEFIHFGDDSDATERLRQLDDELTPDIIDTEPARGDVNKMILGSFVPEYDEQNESVPWTPVPREDSPEMSGTSTTYRPRGNSLHSRSNTMHSISEPPPPITEEPAEYKESVEYSPHNPKRSSHGYYRS